MDGTPVVPEVVMRTYAPLPQRCGLGDTRLQRRVRRMVEQFSDQPNCTIPQATDNRNDMDATYNFFANARVSHDAILNSFLPPTQQLIRAQSRILIIQDTTDCNYDALEDTVGLGYTDGADVRGLMVHCSLALTPEGREQNPPAGVEAVCWCLVTTQPIATLEEAIQALREYALRWRIERFHFVLKSGCQVEQLQLETADRLSNAVAVFSQVAVRLLRLTYLARVASQPPVQDEFTPDEVAVLNHCRQLQEKNQQVQVATIQEAVRVIARLGGHLGRKGDGPPGAKTLWRGLRRLHDFVIGRNINKTSATGNTRNE